MENGYKKWKVWRHRECWTHPNRNQCFATQFSRKKKRQTLWCCPSIALNCWKTTGAATSFWSPFRGDICFLWNTLAPWGNFWWEGALWRPPISLSTIWASSFMQEETLSVRVPSVYCLSVLIWGLRFCRTNRWKVQMDRVGRRCLPFAFFDCEGLWGGVGEVLQGKRNFRGGRNCGSSQTRWEVRREGGREPRPSVEQIRNIR